MSDQDAVIEQAVARVQVKFSQAGQTLAISKPDSWRFIGLDLHVGRGYTMRLTPVEAGIHLEAISPAGWPAAAPETAPADITPDVLADRVLTLYEKAVG